MKTGRLPLLFALLALSLLPRPGHTAEPRDGTLDPLVASRVRDLATAKGPSAYAALRALWRAWEVADVDQVEEALAVAAIDPALSPPARSYAGLLHAYARLRRGDLEGAQRRVAALGYVHDWLVVGPFDNDNKIGMAEPYPPELELGEPVLLDRSYEGKERPVRWRRAPDVHRYGWVDAGAMMRPNRDSCAYATTFVQSETPRKASLWLGVTGAFKLYFDEQLVAVDEEYRSLDADRFSAPITLEAGAMHRITVKLCSDESPAALSLRLAEPDGSAARGFSVAASEEASTAAARRMRAQRASGARRTAALDNAAKGPIQAFASQLAAAPDDPAVMEAYAHYLVATGGDPEGTHLARDMASRAAEAAPTLDRLLLAGALAEDRNGQRTWLDRAEAMVEHRPDAFSDEQRMQLLLARAQHAKSGPNWRDALPYYREMERLAPGNVVALLGRVELYVEAGLNRTALDELTRAVAARPHSVALLRARSAQLRALGREKEAAEAEERYAALRFDDPGFLQQRLELAVARRDPNAVRRWAERLVGSDPAAVWTYAEVAKAWRAIGRGDEAIASYQRALAIAPEDTAILHALADLHGERGDRAAQRELLASILRLTPQDTSVRDYLEHVEPAQSREDERYAWSADRFMPLAERPNENGVSQRTLRKLAVTTVYSTGLASRFHQVVYQPLTEDAARRGRQFAFSYHADRQIVQLRSARVHRKEGGVDETVTTAEAPAHDPSINMYTLQRVHYVQLPRLEPGDVVELSYRIDDVAVRNEMADYFGEIEYLQDTEPVANAEYVLIAPSSRKLHVQAVGLPGVKSSRTEQGDRAIWRFEVNDLPAVAVEPRMPPLAETLGHVHASTMSTWGEVGRWYWSLAKEKLEPDDHVRRLARELTAGRTEVRDQVAAIYRHAASETRYVALELGIEGIRPRRAALTLARGWGDCKDKAALIVSMLEELGIASELVLVRTGLRGGIDTRVASLAPFDHAIVYVPSLDLYLDGTAEGSGSGELPAMDRGAVGLRISNGEGKLVTLPYLDAASSVESRDLELTLDREGKLRFTANLSNQGVTAPSWRSRYHAESARRERLTADLTGLLGPVELDADPRALVVSDPEAIEAPLSVRLRGQATATRDGVGWSVPLGPKMGMVASYASLPSRAHELSVGPPRTLRERWTLDLPAGSRVLSKPRPMTLDTPFARYRLTVTEPSPNRITVEVTLELLRARISPAEYPAWRELCQRIDSAGVPRVLIAR